MPLHTAWPGKTACELTVMEKYRKGHGHMLLHGKAHHSTGRERRPLVGMESLESDRRGSSQNGLQRKELNSKEGEAQEEVG